MKNPILYSERGTFSAVLISLMALTFLLAPLAVASANAPPVSGNQEFTSVIDDLPLMPGLKTVEGSDVLFVEPHVGRIAETTASGTVMIDDVYNFYRRSLPHLGWKVIDGHTYVRDSEHLVIDAHADGQITTVQFSVKPAS